MLYCILLSSSPGSRSRLPIIIIHFDVFLAGWRRNPTALMFNSNFLILPRCCHPPAGFSVASRLAPRLAVLFFFLFTVAVVLASSIAAECYTDATELPQLDLRWHRLIKETDNRDANSTPLHGSRSESQPLRLKLQREAFDDRFESLRRAIYTDEIRRGRVVDRLRRRSTLSYDSSLAANTSAELTSLVISGASVGAGEYFVSLSVGTPPQNLYLIADTGSDLSWVKCTAPCTGECSSTDRSFVPANSTSFQSVSCISRQCASSFFPPTCSLSGACKFQYSYTDQSFATGDLAFESITLGSGSGTDTKVSNLLIGCGKQYAGASFEKAGGVIGLGQGPLSLPSQLAAQSYSNMLSYCLVDFFGPSWSKGSLAFGQTTFRTTLQYSPLLKNPFAGSYYYVGLDGVSVAGTALPIPTSVWDIDLQGNGGTIVDSGTTVAQFVEPAYALIRAAFQQSITYPLAEPVAGLDLCYNVTGISNVSFPQFSISLQGDVTLNPPQDNYFTEATEGITCLAMLGVPLPGFSVLGNLLQQNYHVQFDRLRNRVGFAPANCSSLQD